MKKNIIFITLILVASILLGVFIFKLNFRPYSLGLDIAGGTILIYNADLNNINPNHYSDALNGLKDIIERRINYTGVKEPRVSIEKHDNQYQLVVELAGIKDINKAIKMIGETPYLEFKEARSDTETKEILALQEEEKKKPNPDQKILSLDPYFKKTSLTGRYLQSASVAFDPTTNMPIVDLQFNTEGAQIFAELTKKNLGKPLAIYLDNQLISAPIVRDEIISGRAQISGRFTLNEAKQLAMRLNQGALPVPITLVSQQTISSILGENSLNKIIKAGIIGLIGVIIFMIIVYRFWGSIASLALIIYTISSLAIFKAIPITLTLASLTGFILSLGMAVDANVLIFEYAKEEKRNGKPDNLALEEGFKKSWAAIRDSNISTIISAIILYYFSSSMIRGFALTLAIGVGVDLLTVIYITKILLQIIYFKTK
ncbi:MAG: protein translocase subunit SecD [Minisyncoccia bacterium]|jgi:protein-export membrane protein SecD